MSLAAVHATEAAYSPSQLRELIARPFRQAHLSFPCRTEPILKTQRAATGPAVSSDWVWGMFHQGRPHWGALRGVPRRAELSYAVDPGKLKVWHQPFGAQDSPAGTTTAEIQNIPKLIIDDASRQRPRAGGRRVLHAFC